MYRINTANLVQNKLFICKEWHIQPSEIDRMFYYEFELIKQEINIVQKEHEKQQKEQEKQYAGMQKSMSPSSMMNAMKNNMPGMKMPSLPKISVPKM